MGRLIAPEDSRHTRTAVLGLISTALLAPLLLWWLISPGLKTGPTEELPMRRLLTALALLVVVSAFVAPSHAAAQQSLNVYLGGFSPSPEDARSRSGGRSDDVL